MEKIFKAIDYMTVVHQNQFRKGSLLPKSTHLFAVAAILLKHGYDEDVVIAGLLHDVVEDTNHSIDEIRLLFGKKVADYVLAETEIDKKNPWKMRKKMKINDLKNVNHQVKAIAAADKMHNLYSLYRDYQEQGETIWENFNASKRETIWYYKEVIKAICHDAEGPIFTELKQLADRIGELDGKNN